MDRENEFEDEDLDLEEDAEQLDELSKDTLGRYIKRSVSDVSDMHDYGVPKHSRGMTYAKILKRHRGIGKATDRLAKEDMDEGHNPMTAEVDSVASVRAAGMAGPIAKKRKGDQSNSMPMQKLKSGMVRELFDVMNEMTVEDLELVQAFMAGELELAADYDGAEYDFNEDLDTLVADEATLSEGFKDKAATIMEAAVNAKVREVAGEIEAQYEAAFAEAVDDVTESMIDQLDSYLDHVADAWMEENELALVNGLRSEVSESFMSQLRDLLAEHYIDIPDDRVDLVDELAESVDALEEELNGNIEKIMSLSEELEFYKREAIIAEASYDLADTQADKLHALAEAVDFDDEESFAEKIATIKETYFTKKKTPGVMSEQVENDEDEVEASPAMAAYVNALKKSQK